MMKNCPWGSASTYFWPKMIIQHAFLLPTPLLAAFYCHHKGVLEKHVLNSLHHFHHCLIFHARPAADICHCYLVFELSVPSLSLTRQLCL